MEKWDAYDRNFNKLENVVLIRDEPVPEGMYHIVVQVTVRHADGTWLLMRRDPRKPAGGMWEATAAGSALQGETPEQAAARELREETGVIAEKLEPIREVWLTNAVICAFFCETDCPKDSVTLQETETVAYRWVTTEELLAMGDDELLTRRIGETVRAFAK